MSEAINFDGFWKQARVHVWYAAEADDYKIKIRFGEFIATYTITHEFVIHGLSDNFRKQIYSDFVRQIDS